MRQAITRVWSRYATFTGRASRPEFWWWALFTVIIFGLTQMVDDYVIAPAIGLERGSDGSARALSAIVALVLLLPGLAVAVRRLHDSNRRGWWVLIVLIPVLGSLILIYFYLQPSDDGRNGYGDPDPLPED